MITSGVAVTADSVRTLLAPLSDYGSFLSSVEALQKYDERDIYQALMSVALSNDGTSVAHTAAGRALVYLEPKCQHSCSDLLQLIHSSTWDRSDRELPFYLAAQFGKWIVLRQAEAFLSNVPTDVAKQSRVGSIKHWVESPTYGLLEPFLRWQWADADDFRRR